MKKLGLLLAMAMMQVSVFANAEMRPVFHGMNDPVEITVRGVKFFVFPNGEFDFNAHQVRNRRHRAGDYGVRVERDRYGKIRRVGNVYLNYNRYGQVTRMGNIFVKYNRRGLVRNLGRKYLRYTRGGYIVVRHGYAHSYYPAYTSSSSYYYGPANNYYGTYNSGYSNNNWNDDYYDANTGGDADYYYRPNTKKKKKTVRGRR
jgi:hypothetical protein